MYPKEPKPFTRKVREVFVDENFRPTDDTTIALLRLTRTAGWTGFGWAAGSRIFQGARRKLFWYFYQRNGWNHRMAFQRSGKIMGTVGAIGGFAIANWNDLSGLFLNSTRTAVRNTVGSLKVDDDDDGAYLG